GPWIPQNWDPLHGEHRTRRATRARARARFIYSTPQATQGGHGGDQAGPPRTGADAATRSPGHLATPEPRTECRALAPARSERRTGAPAVGSAPALPRG